MDDLSQQLRKCLRARACLVGVGNVDLGDDGFGVRLAERVAELCVSGFRVLREAHCSHEPDPRTFNVALPALHSVRRSTFDRFLGSPPASTPTILLAGSAPEAHVARLADADYDHVIFLDAVEFGAVPGTVVWLGASEIAAHFPQVSTHKLSLGLLAGWIESNGRTRAWLLGVQPHSLRSGAGLSEPVQTTLDLLAALLAESGGGPAPAPENADGEPLQLSSYGTAL